ncbi:hypothetical protein M433DRAFT_162285 [Acidomyces richmondensis BFW]|nr:MAG: hypothetical protein FE78DRAFT_108326 [Acidomyces sp. 'richmondensis']KYG49792.1 hypothetical protein M433DRAFT_162285 [Acidomyces richmondensis BFW]
MRVNFLAPFIALSPFALADVQFTSPAAGASLPAGSITVTWKDSGTSPAISQLTTYTLTLMVGGNTDSNSLPLTTITANGDFSSGNSITGTISPGLAGSTKNGFYLKMISVAKEGGTIINYSDRFTLTGMTGTTPAVYEEAVTALGGSTAGPATVNDVANAAAPAADSTAAQGNEFTIPYNLQTGLIKYAPMQPIPPTQITAKTPTPLYPTSAYTIATTYMPLPSITLTVTQSQTFSVSSIENTIAAAAQPSNDMAKFLARWKD